MISLIVSTYKSDNWSTFTNNVDITIGVEYEIIKIDNPGLMGLCEAYNKGINLAKYPFLCFCHDDIVFGQPNWGNRIVDFFRDNKEYGLLGVAGDSYKTWVPTGWYFPDDRHFCKMDLYQATYSIEDRVHCLRNKPEDKNLDSVITIDGCWMCTTKEVAEQIKFDEKTFTDYHCYDIDYALQVGERYKVGVMYDLDITHVSHGSYNSGWVLQTLKLFRKWKKLLPKSVGFVSREDISYNELNGFLFILGKASENRVGLFSLLRILYTYHFISLVGLRNWIYLNKWTFGAIFRYIFKK